MTDASQARSPAAAPASDDPIVAVFREHTDLQVLATRLHEVAAQLERKERSSTADATEGLEVHHRFVALVHHRRESAIAAAVRASAPPEVGRALDRCGAVHDASVAFEEEARRLLAESPLSVEGRKRLVQALRKEGDRLVDHHREEDETIYRPIHRLLTPEQKHKLAVITRELAGDAAAAQERLSAWSSRVHASAD